jgi:hypothetical protein
MSVDHLEKVRAELSLYRHPLFTFSTESRANEVEVVIRPTVEGVHTPEFRFTVDERDVGSSQFRWSFQALLYGSMNDFMVELFSRLPGDA